MLTIFGGKYMLTKQEKQRNFFKSVIVVSKKSKEKEYLRKEEDGTYETATYKEVTLNLPTESLEEIERWSNEVEE